MSIIVQKFGGSSVANKERVFNVAEIIKKYFSNGEKLVVVVSAQGDTTDDFLALSSEISLTPDARELDVLLSAGEQISISLLCLALQKLNVPCISLTGWQAGIYTCNDHGNSRILNVFNERILRELNSGKVVVVAGFQGINQNEDITTMGRGGSDTTAVAIAASLGAKECQIYTDVSGVYSSDPRIVLNAKKIKKISYDNMIKLANMGAQILNKRSVELAKKYRVEISVISSIKGENNCSGTKVCEIDDNSDSVLSITINENLFLLKFETSKIDYILKELNVPVFESFIEKNDSMLIINVAHLNELSKKIKKNCEIDEDISQISIVGLNAENNFSNYSRIHNLISKTEIKYAFISDIISIFVKKRNGKKILNTIHNNFIL